MVEISDIAGLLGVALGIYAYAHVQWRRDYAKTIEYSAVNFVSSLLLIYSLLHSWNLAAFTSNMIWGALSLYGIFRCLKYEKRAQKRPDQAAKSP